MRRRQLPDGEAEMIFFATVSPNTRTFQEFLKGGSGGKLVQEVSPQLLAQDKAQKKSPEARCDGVYENSSLNGLSPFGSFLC